MHTCSHGKTKKHSQHKHTHTPSVLSLGWNEIPLKTGGPAIPMRRFYRLQGMAPITFGLSLFVIWDQVSSFEIWIYLFLSKQKPTHRRDEGQCGCPAQLTPIWASSKRIDNSNWKPVVATPVELACIERAVSFCVMAILHCTYDGCHWIFIKKKN